MSERKEFLVPKSTCFCCQHGHPDPETLLNNEGDCNVPLCEECNYEKCRTRKRAEQMGAILAKLILCPTCGEESRVEDDGVYLTGFCAFHGRFPLSNEDVKNYQESKKVKVAFEVPAT